MLDWTNSYYLVTHKESNYRLTSLYVYISICKLHVSVPLKIVRLSYKLNSLLTLILLTWRIWWAPNNASKWHMGFNSVFTGLTYLYNNLISSLIRIIWAFFMVVCAAGDVLATFMLTCFGIIFLCKRYLLKYILAEHFSSLDLKFLYRLIIWAWFAINFV